MRSGGWRKTGLEITATENRCWLIFGGSRAQGRFFRMVYAPIADRNPGAHVATDARHGPFVVDVIAVELKLGSSCAAWSLHRSSAFLLEFSLTNK